MGCVALKTPGGKCVTLKIPQERIKLSSPPGRGEVRGVYIIEI